MTNFFKFSSRKRISLLSFLAVLSVFVGIFFRSYNLSWGSPYFFHPDERNIASSISKLRFPEQMNPQFFAYGSLPIYSIYFTGVIINSSTNFVGVSEKNVTNVSFEEAIIIGRILSLILSLVLLRLIYSAAKYVGGEACALISVILASLSTGFIQYSHFMTFEMWLTTLTVLLFWLVIKYAESLKFRYFLFAAITMGFLMSVKISSLFLLPFPFAFLFLNNFRDLLKPSNRRVRFEIFEKSILRIVLFLGIIILVMQLTSPFFWVDNKSFLSSIRYETDVATGNIQVFYSQIFEASTPFFFQLLKVYPFILNPVVAIFSYIFIPLILFKVIKNRDIRILMVALLLTITFFSQLFLFVKWVRYYVPTLPFIYLLISYGITKFIGKKTGAYKLGGIIILILLILSSFIHSFSYFKTVLSSTDTRVEAAEWAEKNIPGNASITSEVYDLGIVPFNPHFENIKLFNFYELENDPEIASQLQQTVEESEYIILPSVRVLETRLREPYLFPIGSKFYAQLENGKLGFEKIYQTSCDIYCKILYLKNPVTAYEQTANVFDRPFVIIYKRK